MPKIGVQHHHAHIASAMAENGLHGPLIGVAFDGTGYGTDGQIWGGEFLVADLAGFERRAHFAYIPLPGGDTAIREPWRAAVSYLQATFGKDARALDLPVWNAASGKKLEVVEAMIERGVNTVNTSSCGRLFDAVASILGLRHEINYEAQAAIELEMAAAEGFEEAYPFDIGFTDPWRIDVRPMIEEIVEEVRQGVATGLIAARFHNTIAAIVVEVCRVLGKAENLRCVCLSGGTFQNMYLLKRAVSGLRSAGFDVYLNAAVPPNDGGISLGQAVVANAILKERG